MVDLEQARRAVLARFRGRIDRLASLLPESMTAAEEAAHQTEQPDTARASARGRQPRIAGTREPRRRMG
jgi:hypothetical protein